MMVSRKTLTSGELNLERNGEFSDSGSASTIFSSQPANQIFHFSGGYIFQRTRASVQSGS